MATKSRIRRKFSIGDRVIWEGSNLAGRHESRAGTVIDFVANKTRAKYEYRVDFGHGEGSGWVPQTELRKASTDLYSLAGKTATAPRMGIPKGARNVSGGAANFYNEKAVLREFCAAEGSCKPDDCEIEEAAGLTSLHEGTYYTIACGRQEWEVAKDHDSMRGLAIAIVEQDLGDEPENFNQGWLENHIDTDRLRRELETDTHDSNYNYAKEIGTERFWKEAPDHSIDIPDDVQDALDNGDDPRDPTDSELDAFAEDMTTDQLKDPMDYLRDIYGGDASKEAIRIAGIDIEAAAEDAVDTDGPEHFVARYDGRSHETKSNFVYWRTN